MWAMLRLLALHAAALQSSPAPCPNGCSGHGVCRDGECICEPEYTSSDCSTSARRPPR